MRKLLLTLISLSAIATAVLAGCKAGVAVDPNHDKAPPPTSTDVLPAR